MRLNALAALAALLVVALAACDGSAGNGADADGGVTSPDAASALPLPGFGALSGPCDQLDMSELLADGTPQLIRWRLDFGTDPYDDPADRDQLTAGGEVMVATPNAGGSSVLSETFAYEALARCELASLLKTETEIVYDDSDSKKTDFLVAIDGQKVGVSVTRAMTFPLGEPYTEEAARTLLTRKLDDIAVSTANVSAGDAWHKQILAYLAYDDQHADLVANVWQSLSAEEQGDAIVIVVTSDGDDTFIYDE
jgi:hypothetical protein